MRLYTAVAYVSAAYRFAINDTLFGRKVNILKAENIILSRYHLLVIRTADEKAAELLDDIVKGTGTIIDFTKTRI